MEFKFLKEELKDYVIYEDGSIKNIKKNIYLKGDINNFGYPRVTIIKNRKKYRFFRHRLVAEYFIENKENKKFVNHIDGNKLNSHKNNLEWCTSSENEKHKNEKLNPLKLDKKIKVTIKNEIFIFNSRKEASEYLKISYKVLLRLIKNKTKKGKYKDYSFECLGRLNENNFNEPKYKKINQKENKTLLSYSI